MTMRGHVMRALVSSKRVRVFAMTFVLSVATQCLLGWLAPSLLVINSPAFILALAVASVLYGDFVDGPALLPVVLLLTIPIAIGFGQLAWLGLFKLWRLLR
jgi:hypothetical protein